MYCGCFFLVDEFDRRYLPQVDVSAHTTILATTSRTTLTQNFVNPDSNRRLDKLHYVFPLYDGVSVVRFTCTVGSRVITGVVKERQKAQQVFKDAISRGETAGLLEQSLDASDVFTTTIGNVPAGEKIKVEITYLGELKHDAEVDGLRFTIPTDVAPRYGESAVSLSSNTNKGGINITIDVDMPDGSAIKSVQSPSHPLSVSIGTTSTAPSADASLQKASASLSLGTAELEKDFVIQIVATNLGNPSAVLETHPTIPHQQALMATLVPKFNLPTEKPEIVFVCDRSGSMGGKIPDLKAALQIFLKSLPVGVKFNICSFGSHHDFLWTQSKSYGQETLDRAVKYINEFDADYGGTEMYGPVEDTFKRRYKDMNLEVFLLTDGEIWDQDRLFGLINREVAESKGAIRVFTLGVGSGASTALIEGVARAGKGFAQSVADDEKMDKKIVRMLKGALFPHVSDYSLEIKYRKEDVPSDDDFEFVDEVAAPNIVIEDDKAVEGKTPKEPISLFDPTTMGDDAGSSPTVDDKFDHLPAVAVPRYLQTPSEIPPLFPFNRTSVYILLSDSAGGPSPDQRPKSVLLKGTSTHGPLELEIPITVLPEKGSTIHQLAAKKAVNELEEGRGWLSLAKDSEGRLLKDRLEGRFSDLAEREAVRLGVQYQVGGKWCSFVAVEQNGSGDESESREEMQQIQGQKAGRRNMMAGASLFSAKPMARIATVSFEQASAPLFGSAAPQMLAFSSARASSAFGMPGSSLAAKQMSQMPAGSAAVNEEAYGDDDTDMGFGLFDDGPSASDTRANKRPPSPKIDISKPLQALISLQAFDGSWTWSKDLEKVLGTNAQAVSQLNWPANVTSLSDREVLWATVCAIVFFKKRLAAEKESWEMVVDKAESHVEIITGEKMDDLEKVVEGFF